MRCWLLGVVWIFLGATLSAAPAAVRSGDHPNFARIVIDIPIGATWEVGRVTDGYAVRVDGVDSYDIEGVFSRISTSRISKVESQSAPIQFVLLSDCKCHATAFLWKPNKLVVDINDGQAPENARFEDKLDVVSAALTLPILTMRGGTTPQSKVKLTPAFDISAAVEDHAQLDALEKVVVESLARAATQGLLAPSSTLKLSAALPIHIDAHVARNEPGLLTHTSIDQGINNAILETSHAETCLSEEYFSIANWADDRRFVERITHARASITGEFDKIDSVAVIELARTYLVFGFGREAQIALSIDGEKSREREVLFLMGAIIDGDTTEANILESQLRCEGPAALWAFLAQRPEIRAKGDRNSILREFRSLPLSLQSHLGPLLSNQFRKTGDFDAAEMLLSVDRVGENQTMDVTIAKIELLTDLGKPDEATEILAELATSDSRMTPEALVDYLTLAAASELGADPEAIALGDILRFENKGSAIAGDLAAAQISALIGLEDLSAAFKLLENEAVAIGETRNDALTSAAVLAATAKYDEPTFLELAFSMSLENVTPEAQNAVSDRLLVLGLPERAAQLVVGSATGTAMMERRYLRAQAAVEVGDDASALRELSGLSTERAERLRQRVELTASGREEIALVAFGDDWKLGNWAALVQSDDALLQDVSQSVLGETKVLAQTQAPLAEGRRLLTQSSEMRSLLGEMLTRFETVAE